MIDRRAGKFTEVISLFMVKVAAIGGLIVLVDIKFTLTFWEQIVTIGSGFSADLKGAVITAILISGWTAVKEFWLGSSAGGQNQAESMSRIAEASAPAAAAAVAAAGGGAPPLSSTIKTEELTVDATGASITIDKSPPDPPKGTTT